MKNTGLKHNKGYDRIKKIEKLGKAKVTNGYLKENGNITETVQEYLKGN